MKRNIDTMYLSIATYLATTNNQNILRKDV